MSFKGLMAWIFQDKVCRFFLALICTFGFSPFSRLSFGRIVKNFSTLLVSINSSEELWDWWADIRTYKTILTDELQKMKSIKVLIYRLSIRFRWWRWGRWCHGAEDGCEELQQLWTAQILRVLWHGVWTGRTEERQLGKFCPQKKHTFNLKQIHLTCNFIIICRTF